MIFPKEFFELQFDFADHIAKILNIGFLDALFDYTSIPVRIGVPFSAYSKNDSAWITFSNKIHSNKDIDIAYNMHLAIMKNALPLRQQFGCFSYDYLADEQLINLHFMNNDSPEPGALSDDRLDTRLKELSELFSHIKLNHPLATDVTCSSWLLNLEKFKRLLPQDYLQNPQIKWKYNSLGIWGQFIDKYNNLKAGIAIKFISDIRQAKTIEEVNDCFPLKELKYWGKIEPFYKMYKI